MMELALLAVMLLLDVLLYEHLKDSSQNSSNHGLRINVDLFSCRLIVRN